MTGALLFCAALLAVLMSAVGLPLGHCALRVRSHLERLPLQVTLAVAAALLVTFNVLAVTLGVTSVAAGVWVATGITAYPAVCFGCFLLLCYMLALPDKIPAVQAAAELEAVAEPTAVAVQA